MVGQAIYGLEADLLSAEKAAMWTAHGAQAEQQTLPVPDRFAGGNNDCRPMEVLITGLSRTLRQCR